jgi:hypothetical protein
LLSELTAQFGTGFQSDFEISFGDRGEDAAAKFRSVKVFILARGLD